MSKRSLKSLPKLQKNLVVKKVGVRELRRYAEEELYAHLRDEMPYTFEKRVTEFMKRNRVEEYQVPEYEDMVAFAKGMKGLYDELLDEIQSAQQTAEDNLDELENNRWLDLSDMDMLSELNGHMENMLSDYQSIVSIIRNKRQTRQLKSVARKTGAMWFVKWITGNK